MSVSDIGRNSKLKGRGLFLANEQINDKTAGGYEWLKPDRIMKLYRGSKSAFGTKRLYVIGIGKNGVDCLMRAKHIAENRFQKDKARIRYLGIGVNELVDNAEFCGSVLERGEKLSIDPDAAIYSYLNAPEKMSEFAREWFDDGLKNYTPNKPVYGLQKRQCGRLALFHYFGALIKEFGSALTSFGMSDRPLEIALVGNLGDAFFGGMMIDIGYILRTLFETVPYPVTIVAYMFAGDTSAFTEKEGRDLATAYANTIVSKSELDMFQSRKKRFWQQYNNAIEISSDKPPFTACYIAQAEATYEETMEKTALKIMCEPGNVFAQDDDAEKIMSYNMLGKDGSHAFRYLAFSSAVNEIPLGKIVSYISLKILGKYLWELRQRSIGEMELGKIAGKIAPNAMLLASKAGDIPKIEYNETLNPLFSLRSLKNGGEASKRYVNGKLTETAELCQKGADMLIPELSGQIKKLCENAVLDRGKGPYYALEIIRACLQKLTEASKAIEQQMMNVDDDVSREEKLLAGVYKKLKAPPNFIAAKYVDSYIDQMKQYAKYRSLQLTGNIVRGFYSRLSDELNRYADESLRTRSAVFDRISDHTDDILYGPSPYLGFGVKEAFDPLSQDNTEIRAVLDKMVDSISRDKMELAFKRTDLMTASMRGTTEFVSELLMLVDICVGEFTEKSYDEMCRYFKIENSLASGIEDCFGRVKITTPTTESVPLTRVICPSKANPADIAPLHALHKELNDIWNASASSFSVSIVRIQGAVKLNEFKDYEQWENMRYAYVNDSLKKHGMHIFG